MRIIDRYVIRQVLTPYALGLLVFTFLIMLKPLQEYAETLVEKGISGPLVAWILALLIPQALALTIPMSLLVGMLVGFGRLSADREFVALQACGVGLKRLLVPVGIISVISLGVTSYMWFYGFPMANQSFREATVNVIAQRAEGNVRPRVFYTEIPRMMLYVREVPPSGEGWQGVFMTDQRPGQPQATYLARRGRIVANQEQKTVDVLLEDVVRHTIGPKGDYNVAQFERLVISVDPASVFPSPTAVPRGTNEMTVFDLLVTAAEKEGTNRSSHNEWVAIHQKFAIPFACVVFGVIGLALGATHRRDGALGSFVLGLIVVFAYYIPLYLGPQAVKGGFIPPWLAAWLPNIVLGTLAAALFAWRERVADQPIRLPEFLRRRAANVQGVRLRSRLAFLRLLDGYVTGMYLRVFLLSVISLLAVFYISTFIDRADKLFKGDATPAMLANYFVQVTPQYVYYVIPLGVLLATLITIAVLTRNNELIVMRACGVSLYRIATPMLLCAFAAGAVLLVLDQTVVGPSLERAERLKLEMNGQRNALLRPLSLGWVQGTRGDIYHFELYDPSAQRLSGLDRYEFNAGMTRITRRTYATEAFFVRPADGQGIWRITRPSWIRTFDDPSQPKTAPIDVGAEARFENAPYYGIEQPEPQFMRLGDLKAYTQRMLAAGYNMFPQQVWIARRTAFPFVTIIMTLIAVPFAVTIGRGGAMAGIGVGIALALVYWVSISIFAALGGGGLIAPQLAAWAPNMLFGAGALYLLLTVRT
jgi:LPS export ABC transporter permease LptF/LPS export ABC transporter permease LptG